MANPFQKRATEYVRDNEAFLAMVTPEPLVTFLKKPALEGRLYDRLAMIIGTPGSGKTTLARLFEFSTLNTLLNNRQLHDYSPLVDILTECGAILDQHPAFVGGRIPPSRVTMRPRWRIRSRMASARSGSCRTRPQSSSGLLVVKTIERRRRWRSSTTWKSTLAASGPWAR